MNPLTYHNINGVNFSEALSRLNTTLDPKPFCDFVRYTASIDDEPARREVAQVLFAAFDPRKDGSWTERADLPIQVVGVLDETFAAGFDPSWTDAEGKTLLHYAAAFGSPEKASAATRYVVDHGVAPMAKDNAGYTANAYCWHSAWAGSSPLNDALRKPLTNATHSFCRAMLRAGENPNSLDLRTGDRPLHQIMQVVDGEPHSPLLRDNMADILLEAGGRPNLPNAEGRTALHLAAMGEDTDRLVARLLAHGADPAMRDHDGRTPNDLAALSISERMEILGRSEKINSRAPSFGVDEPGGGEMDLLDGGAELARINAENAATRHTAEAAHRATLPPNEPQPASPGEEETLQIGGLRPPLIMETPAPTKTTAPQSVAPGQAEFF